jgi:hyperosmotically inducible protein
MKKHPVIWAALAGMLVLGLAACDNKGPAERAGEKLDNAAENVKESGESAADKVADAAKDAKEEIKEAAHDVKETVTK